MRKGLEFPQIDERKLEEIKNLIDIIAEKGTDDCSEELTRLNSITDKKYEGVEFTEYWGWTDLDTLSRSVLTPQAPYVKDLAKNEIMEIVQIITECFIECEDNRAEYYMELLAKSLALPNILNYIMVEESDFEKITDNIMNASLKNIIML